MHVEAEIVLENQNEQADQDHGRHVQEHPVQPPPLIPLRAIHISQNQDERTQLDGDNARDQHYMGRAQNLHVDPIRVVPPIVERRRRDHRHAAPGADERSERAAKTPDSYSRLPRLRRAAEVVARIRYPQVSPPITPQR